MAIRNEVKDNVARQRRSDREPVSRLKPNPGRALSALKSLRPQQGEDQVTQQTGSDEGGK
jgi:hypothetical protein